MSVREFLNFTLFQTKDFSISVYEVLLVLLIFLATSFIIKALKRIIRKREKSKHLDEGRSHTIIQMIRYILWILALFIALQTIGVQITLLLAGSAALLVGLGLGMQQIFQDIMSGITILIEGIIKAGDIVEIEDGTIGKVIEVGLRTSKIQTRDDIIMIIPNSRFVTDNVINWSHRQKKTRFHVKVGVAYGSDVEKVTRLLLKATEHDQRILSNPSPFVRFNDFGESSLDFRLFFWTTETFAVENIKSELRYKINKMFRENDVTIPFPQRDIHIKEK